MEQSEISTPKLPGGNTKPYIDNTDESDPSLWGSPEAQEVLLNRKNEQSDKNTALEDSESVTSKATECDDDISAQFTGLFSGEDWEYIWAATSDRILSVGDRELKNNKIVRCVLFEARIYLPDHRIPDNAKHWLRMQDLLKRVGTSKRPRPYY
ncbi:hypothetical protein LOZ58_006894 [Ophidiomyces ophidiicola]|nr:hypothetical protein LOZ58_006894 [Ophidiomyces ophidiicola]